MSDTNEALKRDFTIPLGKKSKRVGLETLHGRKGKFIFCIFSTVLAGQGNPELFNSSTSEQASDSCSALYKKILVIKK